MGVREISILIRDLERRVREAGGVGRYNPIVMRACCAVCSRVEMDPTTLTTLVTNESFCRLFESLATSYDASSFAQLSPKNDLAKRLLNLYFLGGG